MTNVISAIGQIISFLNTEKFLGISLLMWAVLTAIFGLLGCFIKGKKE